MSYICAYINELFRRMIEKKLPRICPSCSSPMKVKKLLCTHCDTEVDGVFDLPLLASLCVEDQLFIIDFVKVGGSLKQMAENMKLSYPTIRNQLDDIIARLKAAQKSKPKTG